MHVALDRRKDHRALRRPCTAGALCFHERLQVRDGTLHRARALHHLRQEELALAEEVADDLHPVHQGTFDHVERLRRVATRLLDVVLDEVCDPVHERVLEPLLDGCVPPAEVVLTLRGAPFERPGERE